MQSSEGLGEEPSDRQVISAIIIINNVIFVNVIIITIVIIVIIIIIVIRNVRFCRAARAWGRS